VSALADLVARALLVLRAWLGLRRPPRLRWLASIGHPRRFARAAIVPAGRHAALALAFLPRARRDEATLAFLACKALDALEDLSPDQAAAQAALRAALAYLLGEAVHPPRAERLRATRDSDRVEALLAARLPLLRAALEDLPADRSPRVRVLLRRVAEGMLRGERERGRYADGVLGETVRYAAEVCAPEAAPPAAACRAAGRALQLANDLRDLEVDSAASTDLAHTRRAMLYRALPDLVAVPCLLRWLPATASRGARAATTLLAVTTCTFYQRQLDEPLPARLRHPLRAALAAALSRRAYLATVAAIEAALRGALGRVAGPGVALPAASPFAVPSGASETASTAAALIALALELAHAVPEAKLDAAAAPPGKAILLADYLWFTAVEHLSALGARSITHVAALLDRLAVHADAATAARADDLAAFVASIAGEGQ